MVARGEMWWFEHADAGRRPALVLTREEALPVLRNVLVVPATRTIRHIPTEVLLDADDNMPFPCALTLDNVRVASQSLLVERITRLSPVRMAAVCRALMVATACGELASSPASPAS